MRYHVLIAASIIACAVVHSGSPGAPGGGLRVVRHRVMPSFVSYCKRTEPPTSRQPFCLIARRRHVSPGQLRLLDLEQDLHKRSRIVVFRYNEFVFPGQVSPKLYSWYVSSYVMAPSQEDGRWFDLSSAIPSVCENFRHLNDRGKLRTSASRHRHKIRG